MENLSLGQGILSGLGRGHAPLSFILKRIETLKDDMKGKIKLLEDEKNEMKEKIQSLENDIKAMNTLMKGRKRLKAMKAKKGRKVLKTMK